jgi:hypothetical protein
MTRFVANAEQDRRAFFQLFRQASGVPGSRIMFHWRDQAYSVPSCGKLVYLPYHDIICVRTTFNNTQPMQVCLGQVTAFELPTL